MNSRKIGLQNLIVLPSPPQPRMIALANPEITRRIEEGNKKGTRKMSLGDPFDDGAGEFIHTGIGIIIYNKKEKNG